MIVLLQVIRPVGATPSPENAWDLPPLVLPDLEGREHKLHDWHGQVILLNFWAGWCGPCQVELPHLADYQRRYGTLGLQVIGVGLDDPAKLGNVVRTLLIPYPVLHIDPERDGLRILKEWGNPQGLLPYTVVIDRHGKIVFRRMGIFEDEAFELFVLPILEGVNPMFPKSRLPQQNKT